MADIHWLPWSAVPFARARAGRKPVLLSIVTGWSQACRAMDETSYADPGRRRDRQRPLHPGPGRCRSPARHQRALQPRRLADHRVPDRRRQPRRRRHVRRRRTASPACCARAADTFATRARRARDGARHAVQPRVGDRVGPRAVGRRRSCTAVLATLRRRHMAASAPRRSSRWRRRCGCCCTAIRTSRATSALRRRDAARSTRWAGAAAARRGRRWLLSLHGRRAPGLEPQREKLLEVNAALIDLYVEAAHLLGAQRYADRARDALTLRAELAGRAGRRRLGRLRSRPPSRTTTRSDAVTASPRGRPHAVLRAGTARWSRPRCTSRTPSRTTRSARFALTSLERVLAICYRPGQGVAHYVERQARVGSFLDDQFQRRRRPASTPTTPPATSSTR